MLNISTPYNFCPIRFYSMTSVIRHIYLFTICFTSIKCSFLIKIYIFFIFLFYFYIFNYTFILYIMCCDCGQCGGCGCGALCSACASQIVFAFERLFLENASYFYLQDFQKCYVNIIKVGKLSK